MKDNRSRTRSIHKYILYSAVAVVLIWQLGSTLGRKFFISELFDRQWYAFKQDQQQKYSSRFSPDNNIAILSLPYSNRVDFWFDIETKKKLAEIIKNYNGPVLLNFDPIRMLEDVDFKEIFQNPQVIRPFRIELVKDNSKNFIETEKIVSKIVEQSPYAFTPAAMCPPEEVKNCISSPVQVVPDSSDYIREGFYYGFVGGYSVRFSNLDAQNAQLDYSSNFAFEVPLVQKVSRLMVPSQVLPAIGLLKKCSLFNVRSDLSFDLKGCENDQALTFYLQQPLPLFFYSKKFEKISFESIPSGKILIVEAVDPISNIKTLTGGQISWGELMATTISNILKGDTPLRFPLMKWMEFLFLVVGLILILWRFQKSSLMSFFIFLFSFLILAIAADFLVTFIFNLRTEPIEEILSLAMLGFVCFGLITIREFEDRSLIEKAFSGYISAERLKRLLSGKEQLALKGRERELTTLLIDISGFSKIVQNVPIENVFRLIERFFETIDPLIFRHEGVIDKKMGDGMLAFYGDDAEGEEAPQTAAQNAVRSAVEIQKSIRSFVADDLGFLSPLTVRIGINTGPMMVGNAGSSTNFNYTVLGDAVNFTQRLETACEPGSIFIGEKTASYVQKLFQLEEVHISAKHETEKIRCFKVIF